MQAPQLFFRRNHLIVAIIIRIIKKKKIRTHRAGHIRKAWNVTSNQSLATVAKFLRTDCFTQFERIRMLLTLNLHIVYFGPTNFSKVPRRRHGVRYQYSFQTILLFQRFIFYYTQCIYRKWLSKFHPVLHILNGFVCCYIVLSYRLSVVPHAPNSF